MSDSKSLYERLGGYDAISKLVDIFLEELRNDPNLSRFWLNRGDDGISREKQLLVDFLCSNTGGPMYYRGRDMKLTHAGMNITERDWGFFIGHLTLVLDELKIPSQEQNEVLSFVQSIREDVVEE